MNTRLGPLMRNVYDVLDLFNGQSLRGNRRVAPDGSCRTTVVIRSNVDVVQCVAGVLLGACALSRVTALAPSLKDAQFVQLSVLDDLIQKCVLQINK